MEIKPAILEDAEAILALQRLAYQSEAAIYDDFTIRPLTETLEDMRDRFHDRRFLKAIEDGKIVGSVRAFQDEEACHVERLVVHPDYRRRGIGMNLLKVIETCFPAARRFELFTGHKSESNIRLYERVGYRAFRQERVNEKVSLVLMEKMVADAEKTDRPACPVCGGQLLDIRRKLCCVQCHSIIETCCD
jgi:GNAT superfamily N-acetyltransferase